MARLKKWGTRRLQLPVPGRLRLPRISWTPPARRRTFRPGGTGLFRPAGKGAGTGWNAAGAAGGLPFWKPARSRRFKARPGRPPRPAERGSLRREGGFPKRAAPPQEARRRPRSRRRGWLLAVLILACAVTAGLNYVERHLKPPIVHLAQIRVKQIATEAINKAISAQVAGGSSAEKLIDWKTDSAGKISGFMLNYTEHMRITSQAAEVIQSTLGELKTHTEHIPLGQALDSPLIASFGPDIPVKIEPQGAVKVELNTRQQNAGINMILVEVYIHIVTEVAVVVPFDMEPQAVDTEIPVSYLMVVGDVPTYYYDNQGRAVGEGSESAPSIALPVPPSGNGSGQGTQGEGTGEDNVGGAPDGAGPDSPAGNPDGSAPQTTGGTETEAGG